MASSVATGFRGRLSTRPCSNSGKRKCNGSTYPDRTNARDATSLALFWDYRESVLNADDYNTMGNVEAAAEALRNARLTRVYGREPRMGR